MNTLNEMVIGLDIGGTTIKIGLINKNGDIIEKWEIPTNKEEKGTYIIDDIWHSVTIHLAKLKVNHNEIVGIGAGAPGFIDSESGKVYEAVNIGWKNFELAEQLKAVSGLPVFVENDANIAALGENWKGAGGNAKDLIVMTLGTGVGSGIIANGAILTGTNGTAAEIGHIIVDPGGYPCNCGRVGCLDTIASATGIVHQAMDQITAHPTSDLSAYYNGKGKIDSKNVFDLAAQGDNICKKIINRTGKIIGAELARAAMLINPSKIIIGGGLSKAGDQLLRVITKYFHEYALPRVSRVCEVKLAELGNDAGIIGAAYYVLQQYPIRNENVLLRKR